MASTLFSRNSLYVGPQPPWLIGCRSLAVKTIGMTLSITRMAGSEIVRYADAIRRPPDDERGKVDSGNTSAVREPKIRWISTSGAYLILALRYLPCPCYELITNKLNITLFVVMLRKQSVI